MVHMTVMSSLLVTVHMTMMTSLLVTVHMTVMTSLLVTVHVSVMTSPRVSGCQMTSGVGTNSFPVAISTNETISGEISVRY